MEKHFFQLGDETIELAISFDETVHVVYLNLHENEQTSVLAARAMLEKGNGLLMELKSKGERLISFTKNKRTYVFDPNRMFSNAGIKESLEENSAYDKYAATDISNFAKAILEKVLSYKPLWIVALHNTSGEYSIEGYLEGGLYEKDAAHIFVNPQHHPGDFFFTSDKDAFAAISKGRFNVVLQNNVHVKDDGSLSVYCGQNNIRYINCEALHGHKKEQVEMLEFISNQLLFL